MVQVMILRDFTRFAVITVCVMLPLAAGLNWRFEGSNSYYNMTRTWWTFMLTFVDAGSSHLKLFFCCSAVTTIKNKVNMQERAPLWTFGVVLTTRTILVGLELV